MIWSLSAVALAAPHWTVTVDPLTYALGYAHVQVEGRLSDHSSLYLGPSLRLYDGLLTDGHEPFVGIGAEAGLRWFPWGEAPQGTWLMARGVIARLSTSDPPLPARPGGYGSLLVGHTGVIAGRLVLSGGAGVNYLAYTIGGYGVSGLLPALHTNVGVAF